MAGISWESVVDEDKKRQEEAKRKEAQELADREKKKQADRKVEEKSQDGLILAAQGILGEYLNTKFADVTANFPNIRSFFNTFGPYVLRFNTCTHSGSNYSGHLIETPHLHITIDEVPRAFFAKLARSVAGGYLDQTDFLQSDPSNPSGILSGSEIQNLLPEFGAISGTKGLFGIYKGGCKYTSPFDMVMQMPPVLRPLMAVATERYNKKNPSYKSKDSSMVASPYVPPLEVVIETAKEFGIKEIKEILTSFPKQI